MRYRPRRCRYCGKPATEARVISTRGSCGACSAERQANAARELVAKSGPTHDKWAEGMARAIGRLDDLAATHRRQRAQ